MKASPASRQTPRFDRGGCSRIEGVPISAIWVSAILVSDILSAAFSELGWRDAWMPRGATSVAAGSLKWLTNESAAE